MNRNGIETERLASDHGLGGRTRAIAEKLNLDNSRLQANDRRIIEQKLKDVCDPLSEEDEDSSERSEDAEAEIAHKKAVKGGAVLIK